MASSSQATWPHPTLTTPYHQRAAVPSTPMLTAYLLHLMSLKQTNLCVSADVTSTSELLALAEEVGDSICLLKTHADIIDDFSDRTVRELKEIARRKCFLLFEDRKLADIGSTVQKQYAAGPLCIARWAEVVNAHMFPGPAIVPALKEAANSAISAYNTGVHTEITVGQREEEDEVHPSREGYLLSTSRETAGGGSGPGSTASESNERLTAGVRDTRKQSIVSISTTISTRSEPLSPRPTAQFFDSSNGGSHDGAADRLGPIPYLRALLLVAEMSSEGNFLTPQYTTECVKAARAHSEFVMGFIAQKSLNSEPKDNFLTFTPGVQLPPPGSATAEVGGDGLGQTYRSPEAAILKNGSDVIIVGRGVLKAEDRAAEAERYREAGWRAYQQRLRLK